MKERLRFLFFVVISLFLFRGCVEKTKTNNFEEFYVGTYTDGNSQGIYKFQLFEDGTIKKIGLSAVSENPSFLAFANDGNNIVAVNEIDNNGQGKISSFAVKKDSLHFVNATISGGAHPCYVSVFKDNVLVANYSGGNIGFIKINKQGKLLKLQDVQQHTGSGFHPRQDKPHAHSVLYNQKDNLIISADLGTNQLWFYQLNSEKNKLEALKTTNLMMDKNAGPRHMALYPLQENWLYVFNELNSTITLLKQVGDSYQKSLAIISVPDDFKGENVGADIHISNDGKFLYASNRGHNSIAVFKINPQDGALNLVQHQNVQGNWPRNFSISRNQEFLMVANRYSNNLVSFKRNKSTGKLTYLHQEMLESPVNVLF